MKTKLNTITLELLKGDIADQNDLQGVVNAANANLKPGGGVAGALHAKAGPQLEEACKPLAPIKPGEAVMTQGFNLDNAFIIHVLGPVFGINKPEALLLRKSYVNALELADKEGLESLAFPALSTGAFRYPKEDAAAIAFKAVIDKAESLSNLKYIRFVLFDDACLAIHEEALKRLLNT